MALASMNLTQARVHPFQIVQSIAVGAAMLVLSGKSVEVDMILESGVLRNGERWKGMK
jgi:hypothetical protein